MTQPNIYRNIVLLVFIILVGGFLIYLAINIKPNNRSNYRRNNFNDKIGRNSNNSRSNSNNSNDRNDSSNDKGLGLYEGFVGEIGSINRPTNVKVKVNLDTSSIVLSFKYDISGTVNGPVPDKYLVVLAKYLDDAETGERKRIGDSQFSISDENGINNGNKMCTRIGNIITCEHTFLNVNSRDNQGNPYLFKVGVAAIYDNNMSEFATPDNIGKGNEFFKMTSANDIASVANSGSTPGSVTATSVNSGGYNASGSYINMIKSQLGGYPNNLLMDKNVSDTNKLSDLIDKTFAQGSINVNVGSAF